MAEPGDHGAAAADGHGRLRASHADRKQVIEVLKDAFAQGRLSRHELDSRAGRALASRTYAELAAVIADIPAGPAAANRLIGLHLAKTPQGRDHGRENTFRRSVVDLGT